MATNSAAARMYCAATPASTSTSAACTTFFVVTTHSAAKTIMKAISPKPTFCATLMSVTAISTGAPHTGAPHTGAPPPWAPEELAPSRPRASARAPDRVHPTVRRSRSELRSDQSLLLLRPGLELGGLGHGLHPLAELVLVVQEVGDARLGVLVLRAPEERVERAHLDADAAVHAQRVVDVEAVEEAHRARLAAGPPGRGQRLVALDVDAPVRAGAGAEHADRAVVLAQPDDAAGPRVRRLLLAWVLHRLGAVGDGVHQCPER